MKTDGRLVSPEFLSKLSSMATRGVPTIQIATELGIHRATVLYHLRRLGLGRPPKLIDWPIDDMRRWYEVDGLTLQQIADRLGQKQKVVNKVAKKHGFAIRRRGPASGEKHPGWKGGQTRDKHGYVLVYMPDHPHCNSNGYIREHRLVMEQKIGRPLLPTEVVHHIDDNPANNSPDNLRLYSANSEHLAETLVGKCPQWTPEGRERILRGVAKAGKGHRLRAMLRRRKELGGQVLQ